MSEKPRFEFGDEVRLRRTVRDDGTFPGKTIGDVLVRRGATGIVRDIGTFLQDQIIYSVDFYKDGIMVGCREQELLALDDIWIETKFEFRDKVICKIPLAIDGEIVGEPGVEVEVLKVIAEAPDKVFYHIRYPGRTFQVPESVLELAPKKTSDPSAELISEEESVS